MAAECLVPDYIQPTQAKGCRSAAAVRDYMRLQCFTSFLAFAPGGLRLAIYQPSRPFVVESFGGRRDF